jgi:branched-chain amino acid transport system substrate-binding protein
MSRCARAAGLGAWLALAACAGPLASADQGGAGVAHGTIKVALVDVFSGDPGYSFMGPYLQNSLQLAIDELNANGGLLGSHVQLVTADDQLNMAKTSEVVKQLLADRSVKLLVGPSFAGLYLSAKPLIEQAHVPNCLTSMAADDVMREAPFSFRAQEPDRARVPAILSYLKGTQLKKVGLITEEDTLGQGYDRQLSDGAARYGLAYIGAAFVTGPGDQKAQVQQMLQRGAEAVLLSNNPATAGKTLQAIRALKADARLKSFGFSGLSGYGLALQVGDPANGLTFAGPIQAYMSDVPDVRWPPAYRDFAKKIVSRFGTAPNGVEMKGVPAAADCIAQWSRAAQAAHTFDGTRVTRAWESLDLPATETVLGVHEHFSPGDHDAVPMDGLSIYQWVKNADRWSLKQLSPAL